MKILAIETSCDETAAAVVEDGRRVRSSVIASQVEAHRVYGGVVPEIASRMHVEAISGTVNEALRRADAAWTDIDALAVTCAPGLIGALLVGVNFAKGLAFALGKPLLPVHHLRGHVAANYLSHGALEPPFLSLIVSGGHTHIVMVEDYTSFRVLGRTRDDAAGEALDKTARAMGLPYPGGLHLDALGKGGDRQAYKFTRPKVSGAPHDFSFSGLKTAALLKLRDLGLYDHDRANTTAPTEKLPEEVTRSFAASFQQAVAEYLCHNTLGAAREYGHRRLALAGGVCANSVLREEITRRCAAEGIELYLPEFAYCGDNAAMIAAQGYYECLAGHSAGLELNARASMGIDEQWQPIGKAI